VTPSRIYAGSGWVEEQATPNKMKTSETK